PRMRVAPAVRPLPAISGPLVQALPAIAGPAAPYTASERLGARRHRTYTLAAILGAATSLAALLLSSLGPSDPFALFQHPARHAAVAVSPAAAKPRHPVQQAAVLPPPADAISHAATIQRISEPVVPRQAVPPPEHSEAVAEPMQQPKPAATRVMPAAAAARPAAVTHAAASAAKPLPVQVARSASTLAEPTPVQDAKPVKASRITVSPAPPPVVGVAQAASLPAHGMLRAEHASKPVPAVDTAAPPAPPPMVRVASVPSPAQVADPEPAAAPDPKSIHVAEPAPPQTARASGVRQVDVVQASDARPASIVPATPAKSAAVPAAGDTPTAPQEIAGEQHVAGAVSKPVHASRVAEADRPGAKPVRAAEKPAVAHPVRHELAETGAATHRKQIVRSERQVAARRPLSGHAEVERLNEQSLAAARKGQEYHPAASVQAAAPVHRAAQAM
ncbi:MAG TPA: hypothetical protein VFN42_12530, partial [Acetobacteraceae bacterium]|nr:hypothetical protein [Acetobacteraceae bacterium]